MRVTLFLFCTAALLFSAGCAGRKPKSSSRIYSGDAPSISYSGAESAGGRLRTH